MDARKRAGMGDGFIVAAACAGFVLIVAGMLVGLGYENAGKTAPRVDIETAETLELVGAPGEDIDFFVTRTMIGKELWRSDRGIRIVIDGVDHRVIEPRDKDWGESLNRSPNTTNEQVDLPATLVVPASAEVGTTLEGTLRGDITVAKMTSSAEFDDVSQGIENPVEISVVSQADSDELRAERERGGRTLATIATYVAIAAGVVLVACIPAAILLKRRRP